MRMIWFAAAALAAAGCAGEAAKPIAADSLRGAVTHAGKPVAMATVIAVAGPDNTASGETGPDGRYLILNPPKGPLKFKVTSLAPPPPPGTAAPPGMAAPVPAKYAADAGVSFTFAGGDQTFDIDLK